MTDSTTPDSRDRTDAPDPSWYAFLLALLLLGGTALAMIVADVETANAVAGYAYLALVAGVVLRVAEHVRLGARTRAGLRRAGTRVDAALARWPAARHTATAAVSRGRRALGRVRSAVRHRSPLDADVAAGVRLSIPLTILVGGLLVGRWWLDPARTVSVAFLVGWVLVLLGQVWLSVILPELRRA